MEGRRKQKLIVYFKKNDTIALLRKNESLR